MTKQTILTQKEAEAIEWVKQQIQYKDHPSVFVEAHIQQGGWLGEAKVLTGMHPDTLIRALYVGYEIEQPKFEVGDWAIRISAFDNDMEFFDGKRPFKIVKLHSNVVEDKNGRSHGHNYIRHATKEELFWAKLGRNFRQFRWDDCLVLRNGETFRVLSDRCEVYAENHFEKSNVLSFYPAESRVKFPK